MGQSKPIVTAFELEAFHEAVLRGAARLSRAEVRRLADDLHDMARAMRRGRETAAAGRAEFAPL